MNDMNRRNYFDKFMEKAVSRSIITGKQGDGLTTVWHSREKNSAIWGLHLLVCLLSIAGVLFGLRYALPQIIDSGIFQSLFSHTARAAHFVRNDFMQFFSMLRFKAGILFLAGLFANRAGSWLEKGRQTWLVRPVYVLGACLHGFAGVYLMMQGVIDRGWEELEVTSISFWCLIPLVMTLLGGLRPLFYQLLTGVIIAVHFLAFYYGVSGNTIVAFSPYYS